jgi:hypothetical protein
VVVVVVGGGVSRDEEGVYAWAVLFYRVVRACDVRQAFLKRASRVVERAMTQTQQFDIMVDYAAETDTAPEAESLEFLTPQVSSWDTHARYTPHCTGHTQHKTHHIPQ